MPNSLVPAWLMAVAWASLCGTVLSGLLALGQPLLARRLSAQGLFLLWLIVLARFVPWPLVESRLGIAGWMPRATAPTTRLVEPIRQQAATMPAVLPIPSLAALVAIQPPAVQANDIVPYATTMTAQNRSMPVASQSSPWPARLSILYLAGGMLVLLRIIWATASLRRIIRRGRVVTDPAACALLDDARKALGIRRPIELRLAKIAGGPAIVGLRKPKLLIAPATLANLTADELQLVFLHECAHVRRQDVLVNYLLAGLSALHWFNPALWMILPRVRATRELACDEVVLTLTGSTRLYGETLLKLFERHSPAKASAAVGMLESRIFFSRRIHMIAAFRKRSNWTLLPAGLMLAAAMAVTLTRPVTGAGPSTVGAPARSVAPAIPPKPAPPALDMSAIHIAQVGDFYTVKVYELVQPGVMYADTLQVNEKGNLRVQNIGDVPVVGQTPTEMGDAIANQVLARGFSMPPGPGSPGPQAFVTWVPPAERLSLTRQAMGLVASPVAVAQPAAPAMPKVEDDPIILKLEEQRIDLVQQKVLEQGKISPNPQKVMELNYQLNIVLQQLKDERGRLEAQRMDAAVKAAEEAKAHPIITSTYDVRRIAGIGPEQIGPLTADQRAAVQDVVNTLREFSQPGETIGAANGIVVIGATSERQSELKDLLNRLKDEALSSQEAADAYRKAHGGQ